MPKEKIMAKKTKWNWLMMTIVVVAALVSAGCVSVPPANWSMVESETAPNEKSLLKRDPKSDGNAKSIQALIELQSGTADTWYVFTAPVERPGVIYYGLKSPEWNIYLQIAANNWIVEECEAPSPDSLIQLAISTANSIGNELFNYSGVNADDFADVGWHMLTAPERPGEIYYVYMRGSDGPVPPPAAQKETDVAAGAVGLLAGLSGSAGLGGNSNPVKYMYRQLVQ
jgi:hypothetical protein